MNTIALRRLAEVNPSSQAFDQLSADTEVLFLPLEAVWSDDRADLTRRASKSAVDTGYTRFQADDTVCPKVTPTFQAGRAMRAPEVGAGTTELHILRPRPGVDPRWITYAVRSKHFLDEGVTAFQGVAGLQRVPPEFVANFRVAHVSADEQRRIADFLDDRVTRIDQIITARLRQVSLVEQAGQSVADEVLPAPSQRWARLGLYVRRIEQGWSPQCDSLPAEGREWGVLKVGAVQPGWFDEAENKRLPGHEVPKLEYEIHPGDLLITRANTPERVGLFAVVPPDVRSQLILCDKIMRVQVDEALDANFVAMVGQSRRARDQFTLAGTGTSGSMVNIRGDDVRGLAVPLLSVREQQTLLAVWKRQSGELRDGTNKLQQSIAMLQDYKRALITAAVTGELDVTTAGSGIPS